MEGLYFIFKHLKIYIYQQHSRASTDIFLKSYESLFLTLSPQSGSGNLVQGVLSPPTTSLTLVKWVGSRCGRSGWVGSAHALQHPHLLRLAQECSSFPKGTVVGNISSVEVPTSRVITNKRVSLWDSQLFWPLLEAIPYTLKSVVSAPLEGQKHQQ